MTTELTLRGAQSVAFTPGEVVSNASVQAKLLMDIVEQTKCFQVISGKKYLQVEAWETIGAFNRVHAVTESITPIIDDGVKVGYDAKVTLVNQDGLLVGAAIMPCYFTENACKGKEGDAKDKACKSASQTFATSKAYRMNYSYVAILAGYQPTPAEEMTGEAVDDRPANLEHWCEEHQTKFFKRGKMKGYAHNLPNGGWHNEPAPTPEPSSAGTEAKSSPPAEDDELSQAYQGYAQGLTDNMPTLDTDTTPDIGFDLDWLRESLDELQWSDAGKYLKEKYNVVGRSISERVKALSPEQKKEFADEVQKRLDLPKG